MKLRGKTWRYSWLIGCLCLCFDIRAIEADMLLKAKFIARFVQLTEWPPPPPSQFRYCVAGNLALLAALQHTKLYSSNGEPLHIVAIDQPAQALSCQLLVLSLQQHAELSRWQQQLQQTPVLIITDNSEAFYRLAMIGLVTTPDGISFRINHSLAEQRGLKLSSQLLKLATEVL